MPLKADLDAIDWKILKQLQDNGRITNVELAERVGISAPPCLRRVRKLEEAGIIQGIVAFCMIRLHRQSDADLKNFAEKTKHWTLVRRAWMVSGESDFLLHCVSSDLSTFQNFVIEELTSTPNVDSVRTSLTIRSVKNEPLMVL
jgi:DNA-binding Lrp family transcriptional regulator